MNNKIVAAVAGLAVVGVVAPVLGWALMSEPAEAPQVAAVQVAAPAEAPQAKPAEAPAAAPDQVATAGVAPGRLVRAPGQVVDSSVSFWGQLVQGEAGAETVLLDMRGRGRLISTCYSVQGGQALLGQRVILDRFEGQGLREGQVEAVRAELAQGPEVLVRVNERGEILGMSLEAVQGRQARNLLRSWLSAQQIVLAGSPSASWEAAGSDPTGACVDHYRSVAEVKAGVEVERTRSFNPGQAQNPVASGAVKALLRADGLTLQLRGSEAIGIGGGETKAAPVRYTRQHELDFVSESTLDAEALAAALAGLRTTKWETQLALESESGPAPTEARSTHELLQLLAADSRQGFFALRRRLQQNPSEAELLAAAAINPAYSIQQRASILDLLGAVETPESQRALLSVAKFETLEEALLPNVFLSLGQAQKPLPEVVSYFGAQIQAAAGERQGWAIQGAGMLASVTGDEQAQSSLVDAIESQLGNGKREALALSALGNAGVERSFELIGTYLAADEPTLRAEAVFALRNQHSEEASESIRQALSDDPEPLVRKEALRAISHRAPETHAPLAVKALEDTDVTVRLEAVKTLSAWLQSEEGEVEAEVEANLHEVLQSAQSDADPAVREAASQVLAG
jgi:HEAT repeat protein